MSDFHAHSTPAHDAPEPSLHGAAPEAAAAPETAAAAQPDVSAFAALGLHPALLSAVADLGYRTPTPVQQRVLALALPAAHETPAAASEPLPYNDLMVCSQTGSGKTAAFLLPILQRLIERQDALQAQEAAEREAAAAAAQARGEPAPKKPRRRNPTDPRHFKPAEPSALVLCPTRELAQQVAHDAIELVRHARGLRVANVVGGMPYNVQIARLQNANLVVATPGRLLDLQRSGSIRLDGVQCLVLDEADRMLDLGFADELAEVHQLTAGRRQTLMFSATFAPNVQQLALRVMHEGGAHVQRVQIDSPQERHANIRQVLHWADNAQHKRALLDHWLRDAAIDQAIVFASTQVQCDELAQDLQQAGFAAVALHGALSQGLRNRRLMALRNGQVQILVATDVAARGIDVPSITHVFNFGLPMKAEDYTHRIGRTGRAGRDGLAVSFAEFRDRRRLFDIEAYTRQPLRAEVIAGLEPTQRFPATAPDRRGKSGFGKGGKGAGRGASLQARFQEKPARGPRPYAAGSYQNESWSNEGRPAARRPGGHGGHGGHTHAARHDGGAWRGDERPARAAHNRPAHAPARPARPAAGKPAGGPRPYQPRPVNKRG